MPPSRRQLRSLESPHRDRLESLPPSAKLVFLLLAYEGRLTQGDLASETMLAPRTVRYALSRLAEAGLVTSEIYVPDARKNVYRVQLDE